MLPIMGEGSVKAKTHLYIGIIACLFIIIVTLKFANADTLDELELYKIYTVGPVNTDISTEDVELVTDEHIVAYIVEKPNMDVAIQPEPELITFPLSESQLNKLEQSWINRAIREGKDPLHYVKIARASEQEQKNLVSRIARDSEVCPGGFEIYPDSGICNMFASHQEAEQHYYHSKLSVYQLSLRNAELEAKCGYGAPSASVCMDQGSIGEGGGLWKPTADPKARCKGGTTILLDSKYKATALQILNANKEFIVEASYYGVLEDGRPRFCAEGRPGSSFGAGPLHLKYLSNEGLSECRSVSNPSVREE